VLVTGASGFIGARLVQRLLQEQAEVHVLLRPTSAAERLTGIRGSIRVHRADLLDEAGLRRVAGEARPHRIFHLAAVAGHPRSPATRDAVLASSVLGTHFLLRATDRQDYASFVHFGSSLEYGARDEPLRESHPLAPDTVRGVAKAAAALLCQEFARARGRSVVVVRPFSVYGPEESERRFVPTVVRAALRGEELVLTVPGYRRDYVYVDDVVEAALLAAGDPGAAGECFNVGTGVEWTNEELVEQVEKATGRHVRRRVGGHPPNPSDTQHWSADLGKVRRRLGWTPRHSLAQGLGETVRWFEERLDVR
jgi:nucleoside-diphosphate-sugar epimerase